MNKPNDLTEMYRTIQKQKVNRYPRQRLPPQRIAVRTGALQFGDNEPGIYIESDKAKFFLEVIEQAQHKIEQSQYFSKHQACTIDLKDLKALLNT